MSDPRLFYDDFFGEILITSKFQTVTQRLFPYTGIGVLLPAKWNMSGRTHQFGALTVGGDILKTNLRTVQP